jgi:hypothetical protein
MFESGQLHGKGIMIETYYPSYQNTNFTNEKEAESYIHTYIQEGEWENGVLVDGKVEGKDTNGV